MLDNTTPKQQAVELIKTAKNILVVSHKNPDGDAVGCLVAIKIVLETLGKKVQIVSPDLPSKIFQFLPKSDEILTEIDNSKDFIISVDTQNVKVDNLGYKKDETNHKVEIVITPEGGVFKESDVTFRQSGPQYDLIISVDTPNLERLGKLASPADLFYEVPLVNIDHHPSNEKFGRVNWIELVATSTAEILVSLIEALSKDQVLMNEDVATALLTGLIYDTSSFQNINTTPKSLTVAAQLVAAGARQQEIVKNLYKTRSLETLKLWGAVLTNVKEDKMHHFLWSSIKKEEIERIGADPNALSGVVDELLKSATDVDFALLLSERTDNSVSGSLRSITKGFNVSQIAELFDGGGHEVAAAFKVDGALKDKEDFILSKVRQFQEHGQGSSDISSDKPLVVEENEEKHPPLPDFLVAPLEESMKPKAEEKQAEVPSDIEIPNSKEEKETEQENITAESLVMPPSEIKKDEKSTESTKKTPEHIETKW